MTSSLLIFCRALKALFEILETYGKLYHTSMWELIFKGILLPIFDNIRHEAFQEDNEWISNTCLPALNLLIQLFSNFFSTISFLFPKLLELLANCVLQENENLSRIGVMILLQFIMANSARLVPDMWTMLCQKIAFLLEATMTSMEAKETESSKELQKT
jgi:brefeldin A-inhibited guanine nucleotide-exchange protein